VPKTSGSCELVCEILLLYELLRRRRPDLNFERAASLLALVGRRGRRSLPPVPKSKTRGILLEGVGFLRKVGVRVEEPLELVAAALEAAPEVIPVETPGTALKEESIARGTEDLLGGLVARPYPSPAFAEPAEIGFWRKRLRELAAPLKAFAASDRAQDIACGLALPFAIKALWVPHPAVKAGGAMVLLGCGMEFVDEDPAQIRGLPVPKVLTGE